ncbi:hypothetical protein F4Z99_11010 [Candidatus Poribacteria bacterium]|nr:hypothetical protein [Candidatus Poribacteria bacterium]MYB02130.1 hypothetical protein [Candidatus Poribacteria bacterium]
MAYSDWTLETVKKAFQLEEVNAAGIFSNVEPVEPSAHLATALERNVPLAFAMGTEKAKSELIVSAILVELWEHFDRSISFFSGIDFNVDAENGLTGVCDFLVSLSPAQFHVEAPVILLVEAKRDNLTIGLGQCVAEMVAAQRFNVKKGNDIPRVYGAITSGIDWIFLKLEGKKLQLDMAAYTIERCDKILGILAGMVAQKA